MPKAKRTTSRPTASSARGRGRPRRSQPGVAVNPPDTPATTSGAIAGQREAEDTRLSNMTLDTLVTVIRGEIQRSAGTGSGINPTPINPTPINPPDSGSIYNI